MATTKKTADHSNHRERVREKYMVSGFDTFFPHEQMEMFLFYGIPRKDVNELGHALIDAFGTVENAISAPMEQLLSVKGMTRNAAILFSMISYTMNQSRLRLLNAQHTLDTRAKLVSYASSMLADSAVEVFAVICLTEEQDLLRSFVYRGTQTSEIQIEPRTIMRDVLGCDARYVVIAHNHPGGTRAPSDEDFWVTDSLTNLFAETSISLLDHLVITKKGYYSFAEENKLNYMLYEERLLNDSVPPPVSTRRVSQPKKKK